MSLTDYWQNINIFRLVRRVTNLEDRVTSAQDHINQLAEVIDTATTKIGTDIANIAAEIADLKAQIDQGQPTPDFSVLDTSVAKLNDAANQLDALPGDAVPQVPADSGTATDSGGGAHEASN